MIDLSEGVRMLRNDGIGGTPRLARYVSIGTPPRHRDATSSGHSEAISSGRAAGASAGDEAAAGRTAAESAQPTPGRPPLPKRTPNADRTPDRVDRSTRSPELSRAIHDANSTARTHIPNRTTGECHRCGGVPGPCRPFLRAIAILDRWEPANARRIRAVLHLSG